MTLSARAIALGANRPCPRLDAAATAGWSDTSTAARFGHKIKTPRLAFALGRAFERRLTSDEEALREITGATGRIVTIPDEHADSESWQTCQALMADPDVGIILQGVAPGEFGGWLRPDLIFRTDPASPWSVGEVKVYLDKDGETDAHAFGAAVAQAAASVLTLREAGHEIAADVLIVLTDIRGNPTVRSVECTGELERIHAFRARTAYRADYTAPPELANTEHIYSDRCIGTCALASYCRQLLASTGHQFPSDPADAPDTETPPQTESWAGQGYAATAELLPTTRSC